MSTRVLHIFAPNFKKRFGGPIFDWKYSFSHWDEPAVQHNVLDYDLQRSVPAKSAFDFQLSDSQVLTSRVKRFIWALELTRYLIKHKKNYDILHFHILWWGSLLGAALAKFLTIPSIYQSVLLNSDTPGSILNENLGKIKLRLLRNFSLILPISESLTEDYYQHDFSKDQVITLMNSVDTNLFHPIQSVAEKGALRKKYQLPPDATVLLFIGSLIKRKGVDILLESFFQASEQYPDLFLLIVGPKTKGENPSLDEGFVNHLQQQINRKRLENRVHLAGLIKDRQTIAELYRAADMFIFPSRNEGLPNVVLEAMASGLPVIVSALPGLQPVISHQENGIMVPIGDVDGFSKAIINLKKIPGLAEQLGENAREYILQNHRFARWQSELIKIYQDLLT